MHLFATFFNYLQICQFLQLLAICAFIATFGNFCNFLLLHIYNLNLVILNYTCQHASLLQQSWNLLQAVLIDHDILLSITKYNDATAAKHNYISFIIHIITDLYQIEASFVFEPKYKTLNIFLHIPFVKPE